MNETSPPPARGRLELRGVSKMYSGSDVHALQDINLVTQSGEFVVVVGPSGCGKSTLLMLLAGLIRPDSGQVFLDGHPVYSAAPERAMVFQEHGLFPWLTAAGNVEFGLKMTGMPRAERRQAVQRALEMVHLPHVGNKFIHQLSGGMKQRIAIARALVMDPAVLLMDEPFASLDAQTRTLLHEQMQELYSRTRKTIVFVTHSVGEAVRLADRVIVLHSQPGKIRREIPVGLPHPRSFDSPEVNRIVAIVRAEIEQEVNRVHAQMAFSA
jgi:NitT/TauT family transport system ATP-binding protein